MFINHSIFYKESIVNKWYELIHKLNKKSIINKWYKFIHKLNLNNIYESGNDYYYQYVINTKAILTDIIYEVNNNNIINTNKLLLYFIRIWNQYNNTYAFKIGYTDNLKNRLLKLNNYYQCNWRIIIILCVNINDKNIEKNVHDLISEKHKKLIIGNPINNLPRELYNTTFELYNDLVEILEKMKLTFFETKNYLYEDESKIEKIFNNKYFLPFLLIDEDNYIILDQKINENKYWLYKYKKLLK